MTRSHPISPWAVLLACATLLLPHIVWAEPVAIVNGQEMSREEFGRDLVHSLGRSALESYVDRVLIEQEAERRGIDATEAELAERRELELDLRMRALYRDARMGAEEFRSAATGFGWDMEDLTRELEQSVSEGAVRSKLLAEKLLASELDLSEQALRDYYARTRGPRFSVAHIQLPQRQPAEDLLRLLGERPDLWAEAVRTYSMDRASAGYKGRLAPVPAGSALGRFLAEMTPGELALYEGDGSYHVVQLIREIPAEEAEFAELRGRLRAELLALQTRPLLYGMLADLWERATLVVNLSSDPQRRAVLGLDVVAYVNGEAVKEDAFAEALVKEFGPSMLQSAVERKLIFQKAEQMGLRVSEEQMGQRLREIGDQLFEEQASRRAMTVEQFTEEVLNRGSDPSRFKMRLVDEFVSRGDVRATLLAEKMVAEDITVTEQDLQEAYQALGAERVVVKELALDSRAEGESLRERIVQGAEFELLARTEIAEPGAWMADSTRRVVTQDDPYYNEIKDLEQGDVSGVFLHEGKYRIMQVVSRSSTDPPPLEDVRAELTDAVFRRLARQRIRALLIKLRAESDIRTMLG